MLPLHLTTKPKKESIFSYLFSGLKIGAGFLFMAILFVTVQKLDTLEAQFEKFVIDYNNAKNLSEGQLLFLEGMTVRVIGTDVEGSGFIMNPEGYLVTNSHVIANTERPKIAFNGAGFTTAKVFYNNEEEDIALLKLENIPKEVILSSAGFSLINHIGEDIVILGYPLGRDMPGSPTVTKGYISAIRGWSENDFVYQIDATINEGNSGGPVFTSQGEFVGVVTSVIGYKSGLGLVIPSEKILTAYNQININPKEIIAQDTKTIDLKSSLGVVEAFYYFQETRQLDKAYDLLSKNFVGDMPFEKWEKGYANTLPIKLELNLPQPIL